ncbi:hypothetical protein MMC13_006575 [Lambiella insularis]|nr:hypothetical protein [Lambiella insularis]
MASVLAKPSAPQRQSSKAAPAPTLSIGIVQRASTVSTRTGIRPAGSNVRSCSPSAKIANVNYSRQPPSPEPHRGIAAGRSRSNSIGGIPEGIGNLNRWSQSTVSSKSSATPHKRKNSFARRLSGSFGSLAAFSNQQSPPANHGPVPKSTPPLANSSQRHPSHSAPTKPLARLAPVITLSTLSHAVDSAETPSTGPITTPATTDLLAPSTGDYFGDKWTNRSPARQRSGEERRLATSSSTSSPARNRQAEGFQSFYAYTEPEISSLRGRHESVNTRLTQRPQSSRPNQSHHREHAHKGSGGTEGGGSSTSSLRSQDDKRRRRKAPSQKAMLSKALQKANHAVQLDHAQNYEGAVAAYNDACDLLQQVMVRSSGEDDRKKLEAIRNTYMNRVTELQGSELQDHHVNDKALPDVPTRRSDSTKSQDTFLPMTEFEEENHSIVTAAHVVHEGTTLGTQALPPGLKRNQIPPRRQSLVPFTLEDGGSTPTVNLHNQSEHLDSWSIDSPRGSFFETTISGFSPSMEKEYMPPPLSPRRPISPAEVEKGGLFALTTATTLNSGASRSQHTRQETAESTSWLDTIDESGGSSASSIHSRSSSSGIRRKRIRASSGGTLADFDAALDAAVEEAYDDGFEPDLESAANLAQHARALYVTRNPSTTVQSQVELEEEHELDTERDIAIAAARERDKTRRIEKLLSRAMNDGTDYEYDVDEAEEERLLEEMTLDYILDDTEYDAQTKSALPRQSDSSGFSGRTWGSSVGSVPNTARTTLSTVAEASPLPQLPTHGPAKPTSPPLHPPPSVALPFPPRTLPATELPSPVALRQTPVLSTSTCPGVRERRLSGQRAKQLSIDTSARLPPGMTAPRTQPLLFLPSDLSRPSLSDPPKSASLVTEAQQSAARSTLKPLEVAPGPRQVSSPLPGPSPVGSTTSTVTSKTAPNGSEIHAPSTSHSPSRDSIRATTSAGALRKDFSSSSLKSNKPSVTTSITLDDQPGTPSSRGYSVSSQPRNGQIPVVPDVPTPMAANFVVNRLPSGGMHFFENNIHSPNKPGSPNPTVSNGPLPLEPCPESSNLRPFWFMRCIYNAIVNPSGGYISTRLFVPRDVWRVKNVKMKGIDDKVSSCDLLTAALLKLVKVDTLDADAVLEEMLSFEQVLDQVQAVLSKKLGAEVGLNGSAALFKSPPTIDEGEPLSLKGGSSSGKSYLSSWRKLRTKNAGGAGPPVSASSAQRKDGSKDGLTMRSLPMTTSIGARSAKRDAGKVQGVGPYAHYMAALARLCDAVQVLGE